MRFLRFDKDGMTAEKKSVTFLSTFSWENLDTKCSKIQNKKKDIIHQNQHKLSLTYFKSCKPRHFWMGSVRGARCCPSMSQPSKLKNVTKVILYTSNAQNIMLKYKLRKMHNLTSKQTKQKKSTHLMDWRAGEKFSGWALSDRKGSD